MPQTISSTYRVIGYGGRGERLLLFDVPREVPVWIAARGYPSDIQFTVDDLDPGNVVEATVSGNPEDDQPWNFEGLTIRDRTTLAFVEGIEDVPGPVDRAWEDREPDERVGIAVLTDDQTDEALMELQVHPRQYEGHDVWEDMRVGRLPLEPWYEELSATDAGARHLVVVNPEGRPYVVLLAFPRDGEMVELVRTELFERAEA